MQIKTKTHWLEKGYKRLEDLQVYRPFILMILYYYLSIYYDSLPIDKTLDAVSKRNMMKSSSDL